MYIAGKKLLSRKSIRRKLYGLSAIAVTGVLGFSFLKPGVSSATVPGNNTLVSVNSSGTATGNVGTVLTGGEISANGKFYTFSTSATDIISTPTYGNYTVYVRNLDTGSVSQVSLSTSSVQPNGNSSFGSISETGRYVVFTSSASNLIDGQTNSSSYPQLYLRDTKTNTTSLLSKNSSGTLANSYVKADGVSADGRFVLFESDATNLGPTVTNTGTYNVYMLDRSDGSFTILNYKYDSTLPNHSGTFTDARMSCDGSLVVFRDSAQLTSTNTGHQDVYLLDRRAGNTLTDVTVSANSSSGAPNISCNGDYISFSSLSTNLDSTVSSMSAYYHAYAYDRINDEFTLLEKDSSGVPAGYTNSCDYQTRSVSHCVQVSDNGIAAFVSSASGLDSAAAGGYGEIYIHNLQTGTVELLSRDSGGAEANNTSANPTVSADGKKVGYGSNATNLVTQSDTNGFADSFVSQTGY